MKSLLKRCNTTRFKSITTRFTSLSKRKARFYTTCSLTNDNEPMNFSNKSIFTIVLNPIEFEKWSSQHVCSLLCEEEGNGGAGLSHSMVQPLFDANFNGYFLKTIVSNLLKTNDEKYALDRMKFCFGSVLTEEIEITLEMVVAWVNKFLKTKLYHLWTREQMIHFLCLNGNVDENDEIDVFSQLSVDEIRDAIPYALANQSVAQLKTKLTKVPRNFLEFIEMSQLQVKPFFNEIEVLTVNDSSQKIRVKRIADLGIRVSDNSSLQNLLDLLEDFEATLQKYELNKFNSKSAFNREMKKLGLCNSDSLVYLYDKNLEQSSSCSDLACSFAPTFPKDKYKEREQFMQDNNVLIFVEPPGTGKTHFGFNLTQTDKMVIPVSSKHLKRLIYRLEQISTSRSRLELDLITFQFTQFYHNFTKFLLDYAMLFIKEDNISVTIPEIKQYILRFLNNSGGDWIGNQNLESFQMIFPKNNTSSTIWILDEVHTLKNYPISIPYRDNQGYGDLITLIVGCLRNRGSVVLTTTNFSSVEGKIESLVSKDKYSFEFSPLPLLTPKQTIEFLNYFISTKNINNSQLWDYVGFVLQGTIRNTETFLQYLFSKAKTQTSCDPLVLIHDSLNDLFDEKLQLQYYNIDLKLENPFKQLIYKLAIEGEVKLENCVNSNLVQQFSKYLITSGISFKLKSCFERARMLKYLYSTQTNWFDDCYSVLSNGNLSTSISSLSEVFVIDFLNNNFEMVQKLVPNSYVESYSLASNYFYTEDIDLTLLESGETNLTSLMIQSFSNNTVPKNCVISKFMSRPYESDRQCILAMLKNTGSSSSKYPNFIPLSISISQMDSENNDNFDNQVVQDFLKTDIYNMYLDPSGKPSVNIEDSLTHLKKGKGMRVRLLIHPNQKFTKTLHERVKNGLFDNSHSLIRVKKVLTDYSVILDDNSCLIEISSGIEQKFVEWKSFVSLWKKYFH